jgi:hypothetical protein
MIAFLLEVDHFFRAWSIMALARSTAIRFSIHLRYN